MLNNSKVLKFLIGFALLFGVLTGAIFANLQSGMAKTGVVTFENANKDSAEWGDFHTYFSGETFGTKDVLTGVAVIKPGQEIHPPHRHAEEEYLMVTEGEGEWHVNGKDFKATKGDMLYAAPWDIHGIKNTGDKPLTFVVWKWNNKGKTAPPEKN